MNKSNTRALNLTALALAAFLSLPAFAGEAGKTAPISAWQLSYQRETAGDFGGALSALQGPLQQPESQQLALLRSGWLLYRQGNYSAGYESYQKALKLNPNSLDARMGMMLTLMAQKRWEEALTQGNQALPGGDNYLLQVRMLVCEESLQQWTAMRSRAQRLAARFPTESTPWIYLARAENWLGNTDASLAAYRMVQRLDPTNSEAGLYVKP